MRLTAPILITLSALLFISMMSYAIMTTDKQSQTYKDHVKDSFITIEIDGEEYLYGSFTKNVVLIPKTRKCSCDTIK